MGVFLSFPFMALRKRGKNMCTANGMKYGWYGHCKKHIEEDNRYFCIRFDRDIYNRLFGYQSNREFCQFIADFLEKRGFTGDRGSLLHNPEIYVNLNTRQFFFGMSHYEHECRLPMIGNKAITFSEFLVILDIFDRKAE